MSKQIQLNTIDFGGGTTKGCDCDGGLAPIINKDTNTWLVWDNEQGVYVDTGVVAGVGTEDFYASTYWVFNEIASGKKVIAKALTNRRYPTNNDESFVDMADKITNMSYEEGWFAKIGYTDENNGGIKDAIDYSYELAKVWNPDGSTSTLFKDDKNIKIAPLVDTRNCTSLSFQNCSNLQIVPKYDFYSLIKLDYGFANTSVVSLKHLDFKNPISITYAFQNCYYLYEIGKINIGTSSITYAFYNNERLRKIEELYFGKVSLMGEAFRNCTSLVFMKLIDLGKVGSVFSFSNLTAWGTDGEENRQSLIDSLITYSYDRISAGMTTVTIKLSDTTKALLTEEEIAQITAKGFTIA